VRRCHPAIRPGGVAAFALDVAGAETAAVLVEVAPFEGCDTVAADGVAAAVRRQLALDHQIGAATVVLVPPGTVPKTTSGKVRRHACRTLYAAGEIETAITVPSSGARR